MPRLRPSISIGVLSASSNTAHASAYPNYDSYCNYTNETATGLPAVATDGFPIYARYGFTNRTSASSGVTVMKSNYRLRTNAELSAAGYSGRPEASIAPYGTFEQDWVYDATSSLSPAGHLDACNGRYGVTPESPIVEVYHYYITDSYPFVPRCVFGTPSSWANDPSAN